MDSGWSSNSATDLDFVVSLKIRVPVKYCDSCYIIVALMRIY